MALINCPECQKKISSEAVACVGCGFPIKKLNYHEERGGVKTVELTSKKWKLTKLIAWIIIIIGLFILLTGFSDERPSDLRILVAGCIIFTGLWFLFIGKIGAWWTNR